MVPAPLVKEKVQKRQRLGRKPKKMTAPEWQRHAAQKVAAVAANKVAARARIAALVEVELLEYIPVSTRVYAMKQFESFPKFFQNYQMILKAFWHKLKFPAIAYAELIKLYHACSTRQNLQKHLDTVIVGYQNTAMFMQEQRLSDEVMRELSTITEEEHALMDFRIMKAMSTSLRAKQDAMHAEFGHGLWEKGEGADYFIDEYKKDNPLWKGCGRTLLMRWAREYPGVGPEKHEKRNRSIFSVQEENELCDGVLRAAESGRSMQVGTLAQKLQQVINGTDRQARFANGVVSKPFARLLMKRWRARKLAYTTTPVRDNHDRISWCTYDNFNHLYLDILDDAITLKLDVRTEVSLGTPNGVIFIWTQKDRMGLADETDFPLAEREAKGAVAKVIVPFEMGDEANKERRLAPSWHP
jgi:hypothetical protein